ncbi:MAG TPA: DUF222 domain-containing protein, partial [Nocardioides sp.]|uniref:DUF222 domain-containing protein n=1 Tax=Nocardioides sp. TaxID=35761 RepID=UPI002F40FF6B
VATVELVEQARAALAAVQAGAVAEADTRDLAKQRLHHASTQAWVTHLGGLRQGEGRRVVARAHALTRPLTATREALVAGRVSPEQADVIVKSIETLPVGEAVRRRGERTLVGQAGCGRNAPSTWAGACRSLPMVPAGSGSGAAAAPRTAPC